MSKQYILIGGNSGIGSAISNKLKKEGAHLHLMSRNPVGPGEHYQVDITEDNPDFPEIEGGVDGLIYCPGSINLKPFKALKPRDYIQDFEINVMGLIKVLHAYQKNLQKAEDGNVVAFSTVAVQTGMAFHTSVAAAKGALEGVIRSLAAEWASKVRVNAVAPSITDTPMAEKLLNNEKKKDKAIDRHPVKRIAEPKDMAKAVHLLLHSPFITGQIIPVDGGLSSLR